MSGYTASWVPNDRNEAFWREVLVNRTIRDVLFDSDDRLSTLVLDDGQQVHVVQNEKGDAVIAIKD